MNLKNDLFLKACRREKTATTPVWFMRQAGRYLPGYRAIRAKHSLLDIARSPELAAKVTLEPIDILDVDAAILFADILLILEPMGVDFHFEKGEGPRINTPVRTAADIEALKIFDAASELGYVCNAIKAINLELKARVPLIGFAGAPFTVASYMIEGGHSRHYLRCKTLMHQEPKAWHVLMKKISQNTLNYLCAQAAAGAHALQLFDSWVGELSPEDYETHVLPYTAEIFAGLKKQFPHIPRLHFGTGTATLLPFIKKSGAIVVSVDWRTPLDFARNVLGNEIAIQGNLDPVTLFTSKEILSKKISTILSQNNGAPGHIFNLGHGILPETPVENVRFVVDEVRRQSRIN